MTCIKCDVPVSGSNYVELPECGHLIHLRCISCHHHVTKVPTWFNVRDRLKEQLWPPAAKITEQLEMFRQLKGEEFFSPIQDAESIRIIPVFVRTNELP